MACPTGPHGPGPPLNGARGGGRQPRASVTSSRWTGRSAAGQDGPRSASSASRHSTSSRSMAPPENMRVTTPAGGSVSENSTASRLSTASLPAGFTWRHLQQLTRSKRSAERQRRSSGLVPSAASQSKRLSATTTRFSCGRQITSATLTRASCRWVDTTSRSSRSRATNFTWSMAHAPCRPIASCSCVEVIRKRPPPAQAGKQQSRPDVLPDLERHAGGPHDGDDRLLLEAGLVDFGDLVQPRDVVVTAREHNLHHL